MLKKYILLVFGFWLFFIFFRPAYDLKSIALENHPNVKTFSVALKSSSSDTVLYPIREDWTFVNYSPRYETRVIPGRIKAFYTPAVEGAVPALLLSSSKKTQKILGVREGESFVYKDWNSNFFNQYFYLPWNILQLIFSFISAGLILFAGYLFKLKRFRDILTNSDGFVIAFTLVSYTLLGFLFWNNLHIYDIFQLQTPGFLTHSFPPESIYKGAIYTVYDDFVFSYQDYLFMSRKLFYIFTAFFWCLAGDYGIQVFFQLAILIYVQIVFSALMQKAGMPKILRAALLLLLGFFPDTFNMTLVPHANHMLTSLMLLSPVSLLGYFLFDSRQYYFRSPWIIAALGFGLLAGVGRPDGIPISLGVFLSAFYFHPKKWKQTFILGILLLISSFVLGGGKDTRRYSVTFDSFMYYLVHRSNAVSPEDKAYITDYSIPAKTWWGYEKIYMPDISKITPNDYVQLSLRLAKKYPIPFLKWRVAHIFQTPEMRMDDLSARHVNYPEMGMELQRYHVPVQDSSGILYRLKLKIVLSGITENVGFKCLASSIRFFHNKPLGYFVFFVVLVGLAGIGLFFIFPISMAILSGPFMHIAALLLSAPMIFGVYFSDIYLWCLALPILFYAEHRVFNKQNIAGRKI